MQLSELFKRESKKGRVSRQLGGCRIVAECHAVDARRGGDFYCATLGEQNRLAVVIGDACGHGPEGARVLTQVLPAVQELARRGIGPARMLEALNQRAASGLPLDRFVTAVALEVDPARRTLRVANAGHVPPLVRHARGGVSLIGRASGPALGLLETTRYLEERLAIEEGDLLVFMTDGIVEALDKDLVHMHRLRRTIAHAPHKRVHSLVGRLLSHAPTHADDRTLVSLELLPERRHSS